MNIYDRMKELGIALPTPPKKGGKYATVKLFSENLLYVSGIGPALNGQDIFLGKVGAEVCIEEGKQAARYALLNLLSAVEANIGDLNRIKSFVKILSFVSSNDGFFEQPAIMDAATEMLGNIFGEQVGIPARSAIGVNVLPGNIPVEIEAIIELKQ